MARQSKTLPARRQDPTNDSLLIRSAESLGRVIGSLQRQLDAARHLTSRATGAEFRANGHRPVKSQDLATEAKTQRTKNDRKPKRAPKSAVRKTAAGRTRSGAKGRAAKTGRSK
jgi:hypothetical protein